MEALAVRIQQEKALQEQKHNFVVLSSHYLRTPLTLIMAGIEVMADTQAPSDLINRLQKSGDSLKLGINGLLEQAAPQLVKTKKDDRYAKLPNTSLYLIGSLAGALVVSILAVYLLSHLDLNNFKFNSLLAELAVLFLAVVLAYNVRRSRASRRLIRQHFEELLVEQRTLDKQRNDLIKGSLDNLSKPLAELKSTLNTIQNQASAKPVVDGCNRFEEILRKFIILSSLEAGSLETLKQPVSLKGITARVTQRFQAQLAQKQVQIRTDLQADRFNQDPLLLELVINSLVDNALKYSPKGGFVDIISRAEGPYIAVFVRDQGPGIPQEKLSEILQPFSRAEDVVKDFGQSGLGLSLYLDKLVLHYLGGAIKIDSVPGKGLTVVFHIPNLNAVQTNIK